VSIWWNVSISGSQFRREIRLTFHVGKTEIPPLVEVSEFGMLDPEHRKNGRMKIVYMYTVLDRPQADFIGSPDYFPSFDAAACHPDGKTVWVVIPAF
jgi:hypothetical protein